MIIPSLIEPNKDFPNSSYYLDVTAFLIKEADQRFKDKAAEEIRSNAIKKIEEMFTYSLTLFKKDKKKYQPQQMQGYLQRKILIDKNLEELAQTHRKMVVSEIKKTLLTTIV